MLLVLRFSFYGSWKSIDKTNRQCHVVTVTAYLLQQQKQATSAKLFRTGRLYLERPTLASRVPLFLLGHFPTNECEISDFCL